MGRPIGAGLTLHRLERDSAALGRTGLADYAAKLGAYRYGDRAAPPGPAARRRMRRELTRRRSPWRALRARRAVPPSGRGRQPDQAAERSRKEAITRRSPSAIQIPPSLRRISASPATAAPTCSTSTSGAPGSPAESRSDSTTSQ